MPRLRLLLRFLRCESVFGSRAAGIETAVVGVPPCVAGELPLHRLLLRDSPITLRADLPNDLVLALSLAVGIGLALAGARLGSSKSTGCRRARAARLDVFPDAVHRQPR